MKGGCSSVFSRHLSTLFLEPKKLSDVVPLIQRLWFHQGSGSSTSPWQMSYPPYRKNWGQGRRNLRWPSENTVSWSPAKPNILELKK